MLPLKYLYEDYAMAKAALAYYDHDEDTLEDMLTCFRISSNAVYPFLWHGRLRILRMSPACEKSERDLRGELDFLNYLAERGYPANRVVPARDGLTWRRQETGCGAWYVCVFDGVPGVQIEDTVMDEKICAAYGAALGGLHVLTKEYQPAAPCRDYADMLDWAKRYMDDEEMARVADGIRRELDALPRTKDNFGRVHYDFEPDNVFFDESTGMCHAIDFDDGMAHFFALDVAQAAAELPDAERVAWFMRGYESVCPLTGEQRRSLPLMRRFIDVYAYARLRHSLAEDTADAPEWMVALREKLTARCVTLRDAYCAPQGS